MTRMDYFSSQTTFRLRKKNEAPRSNANFRTQDLTRFSVQEQSSLNTRIVDSGIGHLHHQRRQFYKQEEEWFQNFSAVKKEF